MTLACKQDAEGVMRDIGEHYRSRNRWNGPLLHVSVRVHSSSLWIACPEMYNMEQCA